MIIHVLRAVRAAKQLDAVTLCIFQTKQDGSLVTVCITDCFVVAVAEERGSVSIQALSSLSILTTWRALTELVGSFFSLG